MAELSELEACVLGLVQSEGPCTPYRVQSMFHSSPSPHWSGSAGAIYPVFRRLESSKLIQAETKMRGRRKSSVYQATRTGTQELKRWLRPPVPGWVTSIPVDPLRTRLRFLGLLSPGQRKSFLLEVREQLMENLDDFRRDCRRLKKLKDPFSYAMARGAVHTTRARIRWIDEITNMGVAE